MDVGFCCCVVSECCFMGFDFEIAGWWPVVCRGLRWDVNFHQV